MYRSVFDNRDKIWRGKDVSPTFNPNISIGQAVLWMLEKHPQKIGQISHNNGVQLTNGEIRIKTIRAAQNITKLGLIPDDVIGIAATNNEYLAPIVFASMAIGCPVNPLDPTFGTAEITHMFGITKPKLIFCDVENLSAVRACTKELKINPMIVTFGQKTEYSLPVNDLFIETRNEDDFVPVSIENGATKTAAIVCSSGTTGAPKGVCVTHASLLDRCMSFVPLDMSDVGVCYSSLYWLTGLATLIACTLSGSARVITTKQFTPEIFFDQVQKYKITFVFGAPLYLTQISRSELLDQADLSSLKKYLCVGAMLSPDLCKQMGKHFPNGDVYASYGMSESSGTVTLNYPKPRPGSSGSLAYGVQAKIINDDGNNCGFHEYGEICLKPRFKFHGYYGDSENTANAFDDNGWYLTGDVGYFDRDGFLFIVDRKKEIMKYRGYQISPSELEDILSKHPAIKQVCVVGLPDVESTDLPAAVIVRHPNMEISEKTVADLIADKLADPKKLRGGVYFVDKLPMTPSGKVQRRAVKNLVVDTLINNSECKTRQ